MHPKPDHTVLSKTAKARLHPLFMALALAGAAACSSMGATPVRAQALDATFRHPAGFFFRHPSQWREQALNESLLALVPADVRMHQGQPAEIILVGGEDAGGITDPGDPQVLRVADQFVAAVLPFLRREGEVERGQGRTVLNWTGDSPTGLSVRARMWIGMISGSAVSLFVATPQEDFETRAEVGARVFESFGYEAPQGDSRLVGKWRSTDTYMSGEFSMVEQKILTLSPDGRFTEAAQLNGGLQSTGEGGEYTGDVGASSKGATRGRWRTADKQITLEWDSGYVEEWEYVISGNDLMFRSGKTRKLWGRLQ